ncbi:uncharacterized protein LY89DRAFT_684766 [Mollisia scopiformis]|uniref:Phosphoglycerate mutase n=1 Tax=Mollisia scopiformis TaxID=149040 RepID=A0A194X961_MOLSC|nr:uncharacterized protein LY89DRAFT_684766 [Mollisia scopiformis]KUJ16659.1 hypothetical protein LY89DRAFT_684766 [Mollisia scopiformis]
MGWPPAVIIVVRHGARLDAADKQWHLTSPTPYDPPLTYGGWTQSRALGARIANILRTRETDDEIPVFPGAENGGNLRKRRHKVAIHSSPFLRCVQTSVAISAGLAQNPGHIQPKTSGSPAIKATHISGSPRIRPLTSTGSPRLAPIQEPSKSLKANGKSTPQEQPENIKKSTVRVDAFLGEWLTPDYFELITPPPSSVMMVAGAKADLLRREDYSNLVHFPDVKTTQGFPGGWGSPVVMADRDRDESPLPSLSSLGAALPRRDRTSSLSSVGSARSMHSHKSGVNLQLAAPPEHGIYMPPIPSYAISNADPIPPGYVAHARDACVDVDYQWDSMREPQNWGTGGEYGEEWSQMHKRFRTGIQSLLGWYTTADDPGRLLTRIPKSPTHQGTTEDEDAEDEDTDLVIILVTHGAGCNALIGALTNQPVLLDVGMASLTMAVRKPTPVNSPISSPGASPRHSRVSSRNFTISDQYDVKLVANTEHLRTNSTSSIPQASRTPSIAGISAFRERYAGGSLDGSNFSKSKPGVTTSSAFGSIRRTATIASAVPRSYTPARQSSIGLWSAPSAQEEDEDAVEEPEDDMILNFGDDGANDLKREDEKENPAVSLLDEKIGPTHAVEEKEDDVAPLGLWGSPRPPGYAEKIREIRPKRRWTVNERG